MSWIPVELLAQVKNLQLASKAIARGGQLGLHHSVITGEGVEFSQYRSYQPGDELKQIDWKLFARSDRYYIRQSYRDSQLGWLFHLDMAHSMLQASHRISDWRRFDFAKHLLAALSFVAIMQSDRAGIFAYSSKHIEKLSIRSGRKHFYRALSFLEKINPVPKSKATTSLAGELPKLPSDCIHIIVSDFIHCNKHWLDLIKLCSATGNQVILIHLTSELERLLPVKGSFQVSDVGSQEYSALNIDTSRSDYLRNYTHYFSDFEKATRSLGADWISCDIEQPVESVIQQIAEHIMKRV